MGFVIYFKDGTEKQVREAIGFAFPAPTALVLIDAERAPLFACDWNLVEKVERLVVQGVTLG